MIIEKNISTDVKEKVDALNKLAFEIRNNETQRSISLCMEAQKLADEINYPEGKATALNNEGFCHVQITNYELSLEKCFEALQLFTEIKNEKGIALVHYNVTLTYQRLGDYTIALEHIAKALEYHQKVNDRFEMARCYMQLGFLYSWMNDNETSIEVYEQGLKINLEINNKAGEAACLMGLGMTNLQKKEYDKSGDDLFRSMRIRKEIGDMRGYAASMASYLTLCFETKRYDEGEALAKEGLELTSQLGDRMGTSRFMVDLGKIYLRQNKVEKAEQVLQDALTTAEKINLKMAIPPANLFLSEIFQKQGNFEKALEYYQRYHRSKEELYNTDAALKAKSVQLTGKIANAQKEAEINRLKNVELRKANDVIAEKNKDITDSINYAKRIQQALLASEAMLKRNLKEYFVLYKPKDIVSGDFYWAAEIAGSRQTAVGNETANRFYLAVCDCTGHGVPGAFMSLLNISYLNEAITEKNMYAPHNVFDHVRKRLIETISSDGGQDGMDGILVSWDKDKIRYSAANNAPVIVQSGILKELEADGMPVGKGALDTHEPFHEYNMDVLNKGDIVYLCTDGFADQFGGPKGKKYKKKNLISFLDTIKGLPMDVQKQKLLSCFDEWKGDLEQVDDVLIVGIKI
jgi:serine phosphatase RsbU (regulator of sigma subunit)/Tfp pilus assembly protein PilF